MDQHDGVLTLLWPTSEYRRLVGGFETIRFGEKTIRVNVPTGIGINQRLRLRGAARCIDPQFQGDLNILIRPTYPNLYALPQDIAIQLPIDLSKHKAGRRLRFPLGDKEFDLKLPDPIDFGRKLRMRGVREFYDGHPGDVLLHLVNKAQPRRHFWAAFRERIRLKEGSFKLRFGIPWLLDIETKLIVEMTRVEL